MDTIATTPKNTKLKQTFELFKDNKQCLNSLENIYTLIHNLLPPVSNDIKVDECDAIYELDPMLEYELKNEAQDVANLLYLLNISKKQFQQTMYKHYGDISYLNKIENTLKEIMSVSPFLSSDVIISEIEKIKLENQEKIIQNIQDLLQDYDDETSEFKIMAFIWVSGLTID